MSLLKLHHGQISIPKNSEKEAREFYNTFLGLIEIPKPESLAGRGGFWLGLGDAQIHFGAEDGVDRRATRSHLAYEVSDLKYWHEKLKDRGIEIQDGIPIPGYDRFEFRDPFGNRVEFLQQLSSPITFSLHVDQEMELRLVDRERAAELIGLIDRSRPYLREWLAWLDVTRTKSELEKFLSRAKREFDQDESYALSILHEDRIVGVIHLRDLKNSNRKATIGYWIGQEFRGKGFAKKATRTICNFGFGELKLNRIEIHCATGNTASQAVPIALGFQQEGILRQNEWLYDHYVDHVVFGMLASDWKF